MDSGTLKLNHLHGKDEISVSCLQILTYFLSGSRQRFLLLYLLKY